MKKKKYVSPQMDIFQLERMMPICSASLPYRITSSRRGDLLEEMGIDLNIDYGGIDTNGDIDPD